MRRGRSVGEISTRSQPAATPAITPEWNLLFDHETCVRVLYSLCIGSSRFAPGAVQFLLKFEGVDRSLEIGRSLSLRFVPDRLLFRRIVRAMRQVTLKSNALAARLRTPSGRPALASLSDEDLVTAHLDGRPGAFQELFDRYRDRLVHFITRKTGDSDRAQDLVQEAFIRVTRHLHRFDTSKKFSTWVYTIASNLSKNELRNRSRSPLVLFQKLTSSWDDDHRPLQFEDVSMRPDDLYRKRYLRQLVEETVEELPEHHRLVFRLRELEGKSYEEIAELTGVNLGTVKSRLHRARNAFAQRIEQFLI